VTAPAGAAGVVHGHVAEFTGIAVLALVEMVIDDDAAADARGYRQVDHVSHAAPGAEAMLAEGGGVGVIVEVHGDAQGILQRVNEGHFFPAGEVYGADDIAGFLIQRPYATDARRDDGNAGLGDGASA